MTKLTRDEVLHLAHLAQISLSDEEIAAFTEELSAILQYVAQLSDVEVADLAPTNQVTELTNVMRDDELQSYGYDPRQLLENVPHTQNDQLLVKRMIH